MTSTQCIEIQTMMTSGQLSDEVHVQHKTLLVENVIRFGSSQPICQSFKLIFAVQSSQSAYVFLPKCLWGSNPTKFATAKILCQLHIQLPRIHNITVSWILGIGIQQLCVKRHSYMYSRQNSYVTLCPNINLYSHTQLYAYGYCTQSAL